MWGVYGTVCGAYIGLCVGRTWDCVWGVHGTVCGAYIGLCAGRTWGCVLGLHETVCITVYVCTRHIRKYL